MCKILTAQIREEIYYSSISCRLFPEEQKGYCKYIRSTGELIHIHQHILNETRQKNPAKLWIDYKTAYDMKKGGKSLAEAKIHRGIFQRDVLSWCDSTTYSGNAQEYTNLVDR